MTIEQDMAEAKRRVMDEGGTIQEHLEAIRRERYKKPLNGGRSNGYASRSEIPGSIVDVYFYQDKDGKDYLRVERTDTKNFWQSHWDGGQWKWGKPKGPKIPFMLPELIAATPETPVFICEGEKDALNVEKLELVATCASEGAGKWKAELNHWFAGKHIVYILEDNDNHGRAHARQVARNLNGVVGDVRIVSLPGLADKGDVSDWIEAGGTKEQLLELCKAAPILAVEPPAKEDPPSDVRDAKTLAPAFSEEDLAQRFSWRHGSELRFVAVWNKWYRYDSQRWKPDDTRKTFSLARKLCCEVASTINKGGKEAKAIASAKTRMAVISLASDDRRHAATVDQWDTDPWLLNTPDGVIDLRSGERRDARPDDYMTKITTVAPDESCLTPLWSAFLEKVTSGDEKFQKFLARISGYGLTGSTREHALFFLYGTGRNGKGVFMNALIGIMGDYHCTAHIETFTETGSDKHPTELAMLRGARLVTSTETDEGRRWNESRIKSLTGGDKVSARYMRQDFFEYSPQFKLMLSGNHKPGLRSVDEAIKSRVNILPFAVTIPPDERDKDLGNKLVAEYPGILHWAIQGCLDWQKIGLMPPSAVTDATDQYVDAEDVMERWLETCCAQKPDYWTAVGALFDRWKVWAEATGETVGSIRRFSQNLEARGFKPQKKDDRGFIGLTIYQNPEEADLIQKRWIWSGWGL
jgi:putative DNA primase/helicase